MQALLWYVPGGHCWGHRPHSADMQQYIYFHIFLNYQKVVLSEANIENTEVYPSTLCDTQNENNNIKQDYIMRQENNMSHVQETVGQTITHGKESIVRHSHITVINTRGSQNTPRSNDRADHLPFCATSVKSLKPSSKSDKSETSPGPVPKKS